MRTAVETLDTYYLDTRCVLLEIAATLDRVDRAAEGTPTEDPRLDRIYQSLELLADRSAEPNRAEQLLRLFSDPAE